MRIPVTAVLACMLFVGCEGGGEKTGAGAGATPSEQAAKPADIGATLATVNGIPIGATEFEQVAARKSPAAGDTLSAAEKDEVLQRLIEEKLLYEASLKKGLDRDPKVQKVMINTLLRDVVYANVRNSDFTDEELQKYYEAHKEEFVVPEKVQIRRILIKISDERTEADAKALADKVRADLVKKPDSFKDAAAQYSEDPYRRRGGDVGFVPRTGKPGLDPALVDAAFNLEVNAISDLIKTSEGFNIISVANKRERVERTFQQMKGSVLRKVKNEKLKSLYDEYVAQLRTGADVKINKEELDKIEIKSVRRAGPGMLPEGMEDGGPMELEGLEGGMNHEGVPTPPTPGEAAEGADNE